ncbi:MAG: polymer-forming cytoskeletal protein [Anaeromyxobacteraceae bacterium]
MNVTTDGSTIIGESILVNGTLHGDEDLTVRGRVEGTVTLTKTLVVEATGVVKAEVQVKACIVSGTIVGNVTATESIEITKEGRMIGDISAPRVTIVDGAGFRGRIDTGEVDLAADRSERALPRAAARVPRSLPRAAPRADRDEQGDEERPALAERAAAAAAAVKPPGPPVPVSMGAVKRKVIVRRK